MTRPDWVFEGAFVQRQSPPKRACRVEKVDEKRGKALVHEMGHANWVKFETLEKLWCKAEEGEPW